MHEFRQPSTRQGDAVEDRPEEEELQEAGASAGLAVAASGAGRKGATKEKQTLQQMLKKMRTSKPALDVVKDVLNLGKLKHKAWMSLVCKQGLAHDQL